MDRQLRRVFTGHIAGFGSAAGHRFVVGTWHDSPFGAFTDVMLQRADTDERVLLAPTTQVAEYVSTTYEFDRVEVGPVHADLTATRLAVSAPGLDVVVDIGGPAPLDRLLRLVPARLTGKRPRGSERQAG